MEGYRVAPTPQGRMWTRLGARHRGHLRFAESCMAASQPRQTACEQCQRHGGARECGSCVGHGELNPSVHTQHSSPAHSGSGGAAGTHPRGSPPGQMRQAPTRTQSRPTIKRTSH